MLSKILGCLLLLIGGMVAFGVFAALIGTLFGMVWLVIRLAIPLLLIYWGYRLLMRNRERHWEGTRY